LKDFDGCPYNEENYFEPRCTNWYKESKYVTGLKLLSLSDNFFNDSDFTSFCFSNKNDLSTLESISCLQVKLNFTSIGTIGSDAIDDKFGLRTLLISPQKKTVQIFIYQLF
jgi:hypothetical protein